MNRTWFKEDREAKIDDLEGGLTGRGIKQEIFRFKIPMDDPKSVAPFDHPNNGLHQLGSLTFAVMPLLSDPIEKLTPTTQLHHKVHRKLVLIDSLYPCHIGLLRQMVHDLNLPPHIITLLLAQELGLWDGFAGVTLPCLLVGAEVGGGQVPFSQHLLPHNVVLLQVRGLVRQHVFAL